MKNETTPFDDIQSHLEPPEEVINGAKEMYEWYREEGMEPGKLEDIAATSLLIASWEENIPFAPVQIQELLNVPGRLGGISEDLKREYDVSPPDVEDYVNRISDEVNLRGELREKAITTARSTMDEYSDSNTSSIAAASVYCYTGADSTLKEASDSVGYELKTTREAWKKVAKKNPWVAAEQLVDASEEFGHLPTREELDVSITYPKPKLYKHSFGSLEEAFNCSGLAQVDQEDMDSYQIVRDHIERASDKLDLTREYAEKAKNVSRKAREGICSGTEPEPQVLAGCSLYIATGKGPRYTQGPKYTQEEIARAVGCRKRLISKNYDVIAAAAEAAESRPM